MLLYMVKAGGDSLWNFLLERMVIISNSHFRLKLT